MTPTASTRRLSCTGVRSSIVPVNHDRRACVLGARVRTYMGGRLAELQGRRHGWRTKCFLGGWAPPSSPILLMTMKLTMLVSAGSFILLATVATLFGIVDCHRVQRDGRSASKFGAGAASALGPGVQQARELRFDLGCDDHVLRGSDQRTMILPGTPPRVAVISRETPIRAARARTTTRSSSLRTRAETKSARLSICRILQNWPSQLD